MDPVNEMSVDFGAVALELPTTMNLYSVRFLDGGMHGTSRFIEGAPGVFVRLAVAVTGGV
jgi:hypothetical protein